MRGPGIQKTIAASLLLHLTLLAISIVLINFTKNVDLPSPYTVSLVNPNEAGISGPPAPGPKAREQQSAGSTAAEKETPVKESKMADAGRSTDDKRLKERLAELAAKEKIKRISDLRRKVIAVKSGGQRAAGETPQKGGSPGGGNGSLFDIYYGKITNEIWGEWTCPPDICKKNLEAIISVLIMKDGTIKVLEVEKKSGDLFFDRSALKAITKASPVSPPPYEMEIGIRFYP